MRKVIFGLMVLVLVFAASCSKNSTAGGSWTFKGLSYNATTCIHISDYLAASSSANNNITTFGGVTVFFPGTTLPTTSGTYSVVDTTPVANQVFIVTTIGGTADTAYTSVGASAGNQTVAVTVSNGNVSVSGTGIQMIQQVDSVVVTATFPLTFKIYN